MEKKQDKRNLNTKVELANAFKELSKKKPMNKKILMKIPIIKLI